MPKVQSFESVQTDRNRAFTTTLLLWVLLGSGALQAQTTLVSGGGTGLTSVATGFLLFGNNATTLGTSGQLYWDNTTKRLALGASLPIVTLTVSGNSASTLPAVPAAFTGNLAHIAGADASSARIWIDAFGGTPALNFRRANGTAGTRSPVQAGDILGNVGAIGWGGNTIGYSTAVRVQQKYEADETWTDNAQGTRISWGLPTRAPPTP